jgi:hypothetical protein
LRVFEDSGTLRVGMTRRLVALAVVGVLAGSPLLAYAGPPDPTWIPGFWDDADFDDVIVRVSSTSSVAETHALGTLEPRWVPVWTFPAADDRPAPSPVFAPHQPRGPPHV